MLRLAAVVLFVALSLAGCSGDPAGPDDAGGKAGSGSADGAAPDYDSIPAPSWQVGQWWEWETTFTGGTADETFCSIVLSTGPEYVLVTERPDMAKDAAAFGHPLLGTIRATDLAMAGWGDAPWSVLSFPLTDGKSWTATIPNIAWDIFLPAESVEATFTATFGDALGQPPQVFIVGMVGDAKVLDAEYDVATGWFRKITFYDVDPGQDPLEVQWTAKSSGLNYTGPYHQAQADLLLAFDDRLGFSDFPTNGGQPYTTAPEPYHTFTMGSDTTLYGYVVAASFAGARGVVLTDPANQERHLAATGAPEEEQVLFIDEPGLAGEWRLATGGVGGFSAAVAEIFEVTSTQGTMGTAA